MVKAKDVKAGDTVKLYPDLPPAKIAAIVVWDFGTTFYTFTRVDGKITHMGYNPEEEL